MSSFTTGAVIVSNPRSIGGVGAAGGIQFNVIDAQYIRSTLTGTVTIENPTLNGNISGDAIGTSFGLATLDENGRIPQSQLPFEQLLGFTTGNSTALGLTAMSSITTGLRNTAVGISTLSLLTQGDDNTMTGREAGTSLTSQGSNSGYGSFCMSTYTGVRGSAFGFNAMRNCVGDDNSACGYQSLHSTVGNNNTAFGSGAMQLQSTTASDCVAIGYNTHISGNSAALINSIRNVAIGSLSLSATIGNITATDTVCIGYNTGVSPTINASMRVCIGSNAGGFGAASGITVVGAYSGQSGVSNNSTLIGYQACNDTSATQSTVIGADAFQLGGVIDSVVAIGYRVGYNPSFAQATDCVLIGNTCGSNLGFTSENVAVGHQTLYWNINGVENTAIGSNALGVDLASTQAAASYSFNVACGSKSMLYHSTGDRNTAVGVNSLQGAPSAEISPALTVNSSNVAVGYDCMNRCYASIENTAAGLAAMMYAGRPLRNTAMGVEALMCDPAFLLTNLPVGNVAVGYRTLMTSGAASTLNGNVAVGHLAMSNCTPSVATCVAVGMSALANTTVSATVAVGTRALTVNTVGAQNTACGYEALSLNLDGGNNTACGYEAGNTITSGSNNTIFGASAQSGSATATNRIVIGGGATGAADNTARIGNASLTGGVQSFGAYSNISDSRDKKDIDDCPLGLEFVEAIRARQFRMRNGDTDTLHYGIVAQELLEAIGLSTGMLQYSEGDDRYFVAYSEMIAPIIKAIQQLAVQVRAL